MITKKIKLAILLCPFLAANAWGGFRGISKQELYTMEHKHTMAVQQKLKEHAAAEKKEAQTRRETESILKDLGFEMKAQADINKSSLQPMVSVKPAAAESAPATEHSQVSGVKENETKVATQTNAVPTLAKSSGALGEKRALTEAQKARLSQDEANTYFKNIEAKAESAATKIQTLFRGHKARKDFAAQDQASAAKALELGEKMKDAALGQQAALEKKAYEETLQKKALDKQKRISTLKASGAWDTTKAYLIEAKDFIAGGALTREAAFEKAKKKKDEQIKTIQAAVEKEKSDVQAAQKKMIDAEDALKAKGDAAKGFIEKTKALQSLAREADQLEKQIKTSEKALDEARELLPKDQSNPNESEKADAAEAQKLLDAQQKQLDALKQKQADHEKTITATQKELGEARGKIGQGNDELIKNFETTSNEFKTALGTLEETISKKAEDLNTVSRAEIHKKLKQQRVMGKIGIATAVAVALAASLGSMLSGIGGGSGSVSSSAPPTPAQPLQDPTAKTPLAEEKPATVERLEEVE